MRREWQQMGVPEAQIEAALSKLKAGNGERCTFHVEPENRDTVRLYLGLETQWRIESAVLAKCVLLRRHGIDYAAVAPAAAGMGIALTPEIWGGLRIMEREALVLYAERERTLLRRV